ncbi:CAP domain-containing protein [Streptomyces sp. MUM 203J]|uniref:CAP domain-containing protein n=1 Tax=Streptomyces sp. MUM 203J TaxID=2791990 RepID=UPI001F04861E|nr:CAP domain-containing protein [Streptomyces sp. MUM 203J]MCH0539704.1 CAP domain-containing protein [Streptomyces sp. MUM 203J]
MQHSQDGQFYDPHHDDRPDTGPSPAGRRGGKRGRRAAPAVPRVRRHASQPRRRWTYQGAGPVVAGAAALVAVTTATFVLGGTGGDDSTRTAGTVSPAESVAALDRSGAGVPEGVPSVPGTTPGTSAPASPDGTATGAPSASASGSAPASGAASSPSAPGAGKDGPSRPAGGDASPTRAISGTGTADAPSGLRATRPGTATTPRAPAPTGARRAGEQPPAGGAAPEGAAAGHIRRVVALANAERAKAGCPALRVNSRLQKAAQGHADDMAARNYYEHDTPEGRSAGDRISSTGYRWRTWAENIHRGPKDPATAMRDWMKSSGHRKNILNCAFRDIGVGVNLRSNGPWWVQNFGAAS